MLFLYFLFSRFIHMEAIQNTMVAKKIKTKQAQEKEKEKEKPAKIIILSKNCDNSLFWAYHIYTMIKESNRALLKQQNVITSYNAFVDCCLKAKDSIKFRTFVPDYRISYNRGIVVGITDDLQLTGVIYQTAPISPHITGPVLKEIFETYTILFELIKDSVTPYMKQKYSEYMIRKHKSIYAHKLKRDERMLVTLSTRFHSDMQYYESTMSRLSSTYEKEHKKLLENIETSRNRLEQLEKGYFENDEKSE